MLKRPSSTPREKIAPLWPVSRAARMAVVDTGYRSKLTAEERDLARYIKTEAPDAVYALSGDLFFGFVRCYAGEKSRFDTTLFHVRETLTWHASLPYKVDEVLGSSGA